MRYRCTAATWIGQKHPGKVSHALEGHRVARFWKLHIMSTFGSPCKVLNVDFNGTRRSISSDLDGSDCGVQVVGKYEISKE